MSDLERGMIDTTNSARRWFKDKFRIAIRRFHDAIEDPSWAKQVRRAAEDTTRSVGRATDDAATTVRRGVEDAKAAITGDSQQTATLMQEVSSAMSTFFSDAIATVKSAFQSLKSAFGFSGSSSTSSSQNQDRAFTDSPSSRSAERSQKRSSRDTRKIDAAASRVVAGSGKDSSITPSGDGSPRGAAADFAAAASKLRERMAAKQ